MGIFDEGKEFLLGKPGIPQTAVDLVPSEFAETRGPTADALRRLIESGGGAPSGGPLVAPLSEQEETLVQSAIDQARGDNPLTRATSSLAGRTAEGEFLTGGRIVEEGVASALDPTQAAIGRLGVPGLQTDASGRAVGTGEASPFATAARIATEGGANALSDVELAIRNQSFLQETARQQEAIKLASDVASGGLKKTILGLKAAALPRLIEDLGIRRGLEEFNDRINRLLQAMNAGVTIANPVVTIRPGDPGSPGLLKGLLSGAAGAAAGGGFQKQTGSTLEDQAATDVAREDFF